MKVQPEMFKLEWFSCKSFSPLDERQQNDKKIINETHTRQQREIRRRRRRRKRDGGQRAGMRTWPACSGPIPRDRYISLISSCVWPVQRPCTHTTTTIGRSADNISFLLFFFVFFFRTKWSISVKVISIKSSCFNYSAQFLRILISIDFFRNFLINLKLG